MHRRLSAKQCRAILLRRSASGGSSSFLFFCSQKSFLAFPEVLTHLRPTVFTVKSQHGRQMKRRVCSGCAIVGNPPQGQVIHLGEASLKRWVCEILERNPRLRGPVAGAPLRHSVPVHFPSQLGLLRWTLIQASKSYPSSQLPLDSRDVFILAACFSDVTVCICAQEGCFLAQLGL